MSRAARGEMSPKEAEAWLGLRPSYKGRSFLRSALAKERDAGRPFIVRRTGPKGQPVYLFTRELIRRHMRDLWQARFDRVATRAATAVRQIRDHIDAHIDDRIENHPTVRGLVAQSDETIDLVESLAEQVRRVAEGGSKVAKGCTG